MNFKLKNRPGFTLIEMLVATSIFIIVISVYMGIFVSTTKMHAKIIAIQKVQNEIRYVTELISSSVRMGTINYDYYDSNFTNPQNVLALKDNSQKNIFFRSDNGIFQISYDGNHWTSISYDTIYFNRMSFYLTSKDDHPGVMFFIDANYKSSLIDTAKEARFVLQSFASSRQYKK